MKNKIGVSVIFFGIIMLIALNGCGGEKLESQWKDAQITVDGASDDWSEYVVHYFDKEDMEIVLGIANDDTSLNLMIKFRDQRLARMFERRGVTFWFDGNDQKNKNFGIFYQNPQLTMIEIPRGDMPGRRNDMNPDGGETFQPGGIFSLIAQDTVELGGTDIHGCKTKVDLKEGVYCYELSIPIAKNENSPYALVLSNKSKIKLGIELAAVSEEEQAIIKEMMAEREGRGRSGGGMGGGGLRGGGMRGGGGGSRGGRPGGMPDMDGKEIWFTVSLAKS
ncbi:MAG: hypothetical protein GQ561_06860 [Calditrichae bacterium]|nr:hypothetical protein [Calditrichia bacterium]